MYNELLKTDIFPAMRAQNWLAFLGKAGGASPLAAAFKASCGTYPGILCAQYISLEMISRSKWQCRRPLGRHAMLVSAGLCACATFLQRCTLPAYVSAPLLGTCFHPVGAGKSCGKSYKHNTSHDPPAQACTGRHGMTRPSYFSVTAAAPAPQQKECLTCHRSFGLRQFRAMYNQPDGLWVNCRGCDHVKRRLDRLEREMEAAQDPVLPLDRCLAMREVNAAIFFASPSTETVRLHGQ